MKQTLELGSKGTNSVLNWIMGNNQSIPEVGQWATVLHYTDRTVFKVSKVSADLMTVELQYCNTIADQSKGPLDIGHQEWVHIPNEQYKTIRYRNLKKNPGWYVVQKDGGFGQRYNLVFGSADYYYDWSF